MCLLTRAAKFSNHYFLWLVLKYLSLARDEKDSLLDYLQKSFFSVFDVEIYFLPKTDLSWCWLIMGSVSLLFFFLFLSSSSFFFLLVLSHQIHKHGTFQLPLFSFIKLYSFLHKGFAHFFIYMLGLDFLSYFVCFFFFLSHFEWLSLFCFLF